MIAYNETKPEDFINAAAKAMLPFTLRIAAMNRDELRALLGACGKLNKTNCWWLEYDVAPLLKKLAQEETTMVGLKDIPL